ncbi:MAG: FxLYD domain-containing protein [Acidobacteriaceae bacterium]
MSEMIENEKVQDVFLIIGDAWQGKNRKWLYAFLLLLVMSVPIYFVVKTTFFNISAVRYSPPKIYTLAERDPLEILEKNIIQIKDGDYTGFVKLKNPNVDWGVPELSYHFEVTDNTGKFLASSSGKSFILPDSEKYLIVPRFQANGIPAEINFTFNKPAFVLKSQEFPFVGLDIQRKQAEIQGNNTVVYGVIKNSSAFTLSQVDIFSLIYDDSSKIIGLTYTNINDLATGDIRSFQTIWPEKITGSIHVEVLPEINVFAPDIIRTPGTANPFEGEKSAKPST